MSIQRIRASVDGLQEPIPQPAVGEHCPEWGTSVPQDLRSARDYAWRLERRQYEDTRQILLLQAALRQIQGWDCLNPPDPQSDFPWLKRLVDGALEMAA